MKDLLSFLLDGILEEGSYEVNEETGEGRTLYRIKVAPENMGMVIGKGGRMIKSLRNILKVRATLEKTAVNLEIEE